MLAIGAHVLVHLGREFAGRREDQAANVLRPGRRRRKTLQQRQRESSGLAGAGLSGAKQIATREDDRNRLRLNRGGLGVALLCDSAQQLGAQAETFERRCNDFLLNSAWEDMLPTGSGR